MKMETVSKRRLLVVALITVLVIMSVSPVVNVGAADFPSDLNVGPYVDHVVYKIMENMDQRILALQAGEVEIIARTIDPIHLATLQADADISLAWTLRNGYGHFTFNCRKYPLNISAFRRAFAYAFDKTRVTSEIFAGLSQEHDSVVPYVNGWCIEDDLPYNYYTAQVALGNQILDEAGFTTHPQYGYRLAPDGSFFDVYVEFPTGSPYVTAITSGVSQIAVDALDSLGVLCNTTAVDFNNSQARIANNGDFDMAFYAYNFHGYGVDWLADTFWGELADVPNENPSNFRNATYDSWRNQLLFSTEYEDVFEAAAAMQLILHENVPMVVAYENRYLHAYRNDVFTGYVEDVARGVDGTWTLRKIHRIDGVPGGSVGIAIEQEPDTFNIFVDSNSVASPMIAELWPTLYLRGPNLRPCPYLAEHLLTETHSDNPSIEQGHTRFTFDIVQNATWNDGTPITAEDVVFSFKYLFESGVYGNPASESLTGLVAAYAPTTYRAVFEFDTETYWHFSKFAYKYIIPKHIFNDATGIGYDKWDSWDPVYLNASLNLGSGPFLISDYEPGDFYEFSPNPDFCYYPVERVTTMGQLLFSNPDFQFSEVGVITVLLVGGIILNKRKSWIR